MFCFSLQKVHVLFIPGFQCEIFLTFTMNSQKPCSGRLIDLNLYVLNKNSALCLSLQIFCFKKVIMIIKIMKLAMQQRTKCVIFCIPFRQRLFVCLARITKLWFFCSFTFHFSLKPMFN